MRGSLGRDGDLYDPLDSFMSGLSKALSILMNSLMISAFVDSSYLKPRAGQAGRVQGIEEGVEEGWDGSRGVRGVDPQSVCEAACNEKPDVLVLVLHQPVLAEHCRKLPDFCGRCRCAVRWDMTRNSSLAKG